MLAITEKAMKKNGAFARSKTSIQMMNTTFVQKAHGRTPSSGGGAVRVRQLYQTILATSATSMAITAGHQNRDSVLNG